MCTYIRMIYIYIHTQSERGILAKFYLRARTAHSESSDSEERAISAEPFTALGIRQFFRAHLFLYTCMM